MKAVGTFSIVVFTVIGASDAAAQCRVAAVEPCGIELRGEGAPRATRSCATEAWKSHLAFELPERFADADRNGWHEVVVRIDVDPKRGCGCAVFRITYEGEPAGHSANIGDSPSNDGYGGDEWSTRFDAELVILNRELTAYGAERPGAPADQRVFGLSGLPIADRVLEIEVCDQTLRFAIDAKIKQREFGGFLNTYRSRDLITIRPPGDRDASKADQPDARIYAAFNRVIHRRSGSPSQNRFGSGVRRVEIALTP